MEQEKMILKFLLDLRAEIYRQFLKIFSLYIIIFLIKLIDIIFSTNILEILKTIPH